MFYTNTYFFTCRLQRNILEYLLGVKNFQDLFEGEEEPQIPLCFAGDGRKKSQRIGTVMVVFSVLKKGLHKPENHYIACLYNGMYSVYVVIFFS